MLSVVLNRNEEKEKLLGFPWVFNNEIHTFKGDNIVSGEVVKVITMDGKFVAYGFLNTSSKIIMYSISLIITIIKLEINIKPITKLGVNFKLW